MFIKPTRKLKVRTFLIASTAVVLGFSSSLAQERVVREATTPDQEGIAPVTLTLDDAIEIAMTRSYAIRQANLNYQTADWQVKEVYGSAWPQLSLNTNYSRNVVTPNPFAGSDAGGFFESLTYVDWLKYNEDQRLDDDPATGPISLDEFRQRQSDGLDAAGIMLNQSSNPFQVDNQWSNVLSLEQVIYDGAVFSGIKGAKVYRSISEATMARETQLLVNQVKVAFYGALFAADQAKVVQKSVDRTGRTVDDARKRLVQGVSSKYDMLSAEVEMVNLESDLVRVQNALENSLDDLKMLLGLPIEQPVILRGELDKVDGEGPIDVSLDDALVRAMAQRPDLEQAALTIELRRINEGLEKSARYPSLRAFVNAGYVGSVPSNRQIVYNTDDPFTYGSDNLGFFDDSYWNPSVAVGLTLR
ncbi:MAG: TolC family protein, partial [Candidatus Latescibacterota bacterium]